jgi:hypothetical protein
MKVKAGEAAFKLNGQKRNGNVFKIIFSSFTVELLIDFDLL